MPRKKSTTAECPNYDSLNADVQMAQKNEWLNGASEHIHRSEVRIHFPEHRRSIDSYAIKKVIELIHTDTFKQDVVRQHIPN